MSCVDSVHSSRDHSVQLSLEKTASSNGDENSEADPDQSSGAVNRSRWTENAARCYKCKDLVPHKLLFVCRHEKCAGVFKGNKKYASPFDFYLHEKVFCSACIFTGSHKNHSDQAEGAYKLAVELQ